LPVGDDWKVEGMPPSKPKAPKGAKPADKRQSAPASLRRIRPPRLYVYFDAIIRHGSIRREPSLPLWRWRPRAPT